MTPLFMVNSTHLRLPGVLLPSSPLPSLAGLQTQMRKMDTRWCHDPGTRPFLREELQRKMGSF